MIDLKVTANIEGLEKLIARFPEASVAARREKISEAALLLERAIKQATPEGAGPIHLRDTIFQQVRQSGVSVWGIVGTPAVYGEPVEMGTRPHFPPVAPIRFWVEKKLGYSGKEAQSVAFLIARAISRRGTKPQRMFHRGFEENEARVMAILASIPEAIIRRVQA
jgi:hypothetical protein